MHEVEPAGEAPGPLELQVSDDQAGLRLDQFLSAQLDYSRSLLQDWIRGGMIAVDGRPLKPSAKLKAGQRITVVVPPLTPAEPEADPSIPLEVVFEDPHLLVINKQRGLVVHPAVGNPDGTLVNALLAYSRDWSGIRGVSKPGIVHRLDKHTSGLMVIARNDRAHLSLQNQFKDRSVLKVYQALVWGVPPTKRGRINQPLGRDPHHRLRMAVVNTGRIALSDYEVVEMLGPQHALVEVRLHTGRTHQIRVHLSWLGFPIVGDPMYGRLRPSYGMSGQALHCLRLGFSHPVDGRALEFTAPLPEDFLKARNAIDERPNWRDPVYGQTLT